MLPESPVVYPGWILLAEIIGETGNVFWGPVPGAYHPTDPGLKVGDPWLVHDTVFLVAFKPVIEEPPGLAHDEIGEKDFSPSRVHPVKPIGYTKVYSDGWTIISDTLGYTETHLIHVVAYDSADNETKTEPIRVLIIHKEEEEEEEEEPVADDSEAFVLPAVDERVRYRGTNARGYM